MHTTVISPSIPKPRNPWNYGRPIFCEIIRRNPRLKKQCDASEQRLAKLARNGPRLSWCHAGLAQYALPPVRRNGQTLQMLFSPGRESGGPLSAATVRVLQSAGPLRHEDRDLTVADIRWYIERLAPLTPSVKSTLARMTEPFLSAYLGQIRDGDLPEEFLFYHLPVRESGDRGAWLSYLWGGWGFNAFEPPEGGWCKRDGSETLVFAPEFTCEIQTPEKVFQIKPGQFALVPPGQRHRVVSQAPGFPYAYWLILVSSLDLSAIHLRPLTPGTALRRQLNSIVEKSTSDASFPWKSRSKQDVLDFLEGCLELAGRPAGRLPARTASAIVERTRNLIGASLNRRIPLSELAKAAGMDVFGFCRRFKAETGESPIAYHRRLRVEEACRLLTTGPLSPGGVAARLGFADPAHFSHLFKKTTGISPREFCRRKPGKRQE